MNISEIWYSIPIPIERESLSKGTSFRYVIAFFILFELIRNVYIILFFNYKNLFSHLFFLNTS